MRILVLTPRDNQASRHCASWADMLAARFPSALSVHTSRSRRPVEELLDEHEHLFYFGHGMKDSLIVPRKFRRWKRATALVDLANIGHLGPDGVVIAVACLSGEGLARMSTDSRLGSRVASYLGWRDEVSWPPEWPDPIGGAVLEGLEALLDGGTVDDCRTAMNTAFSRAHETYRSEGPQRMTTDRAVFGKMCAIYWREQIAVEGNQGATVS